MDAKALLPSRPGCILAAGLFLAAVATPFAQAAAQEAAPATVTVNIDVLESLGPQQPEAELARAQALKSGSLLVPPQEKPKSRLVGHYATQSPDPLDDKTEAAEAKPSTAKRPETTTTADKPAKAKKRKAQSVKVEEPVPPAESEAPSEAPLEEVAETPGVAEETPSAISLVASAEAAETPDPAMIAETAMTPEPAPTPEPVTPPDEEVSSAAVPEAPAPPSQTQTAAVSPTETIDLDTRVLFATGSAELSAEEKQNLQVLADQLQRDPELRIQLLAFAAGEEDSPNAARRLSLSRALVVRGFLADHGISATRVQIRALGETSEDGPPDRVDITPQGG